MSGILIDKHNNYFPYVSFIYLLFCLPHKKVTKKVTTANTMLKNVIAFYQGSKEAWCTHPWTPTHRCHFVGNIVSEYFSCMFLFRLWQKLAVCVGCPRIVRNIGCTAFVSGGLYEEDRRDFLSVEGFYFLFGRYQKEN